MEIISPSQTFRITVGKSKNQKTWRDVRDVTWQELCHVLTDHQIGEKDGSCFIPAIFRGTRRTKDDADMIGLLVLDCDTGESLEQICSAIQKMGWAAIIYSTHSHMTTDTEISKASYEKKQYDNPELYLTQEKGVRSGIAAGADFIDYSNPKNLLIRHSPCPKFRVVMPLQLPWRASDFSSQAEANIVWSRFVKNVANALGLHHDQSCIDSSRLYYFPRHRLDGEFVSQVLEGMAINPVNFIVAEDTYSSILLSKKSVTKDKKSFVYTDAESGRQIDLVKWAARNADGFDIVKTLKVKRHDVFTGHMADGYKHHIRCVNGDMHTKQEPDSATFIVSPVQSQTGSFVYCCMHAHCRDEDRLFFVLKMLEEGWLTLADLDIEDEVAGLSFDELKGLCEALSNNSLPDQIKYVVDQIVKSKQDPIHVDFLLGIVKNKTGANLKTLRQSAALAKEKSSVDTAYFVAQKTLDAYFAGGNYLIHAEDGCFWRYTGKHWQPIRDDQIENHILTMVKKYADPEYGEEYRKILKNAFDLLVSRQALDVDFFRRLGEIPSVINCQNGELWLQPDGSFILKPHSPESHLQYMLEFDYDPSATCPKFDAALLQTFANSSAPEDMVRHIQEVMGYFIQPSRFLTCWFMWQGGGSNGKTSLFETLERLMNRRSIYSERIGNLERSRFALGSLMGKILFVDDDVDQNTKLPDGLLKKLSERKLITGEKKFKDSFEFISSVAVLLLTNNHPLCDDLSYGTKRRARIIPFTQKFEGANKDPSLYPYIHKNEMSGVLNRLVQGLQRLRQRGDFLEPADCVQARQEWLIHANPFNAFLSECCENDPISYAALNEIYMRFNNWKTINGYNSSMTLQSLHTALKGSGYQSNRVHGCLRIYGLRLI